LPQRGSLWWRQLRRRLQVEHPRSFESWFFISLCTSKVIVIFYVGKDTLWFRTISNSWQKGI
jgi:hypothetical protein